MISLREGRAMLDFHAGSKAMTPETAELQLRGAVAIHNILEKHDVAYLADEVGMGKTYVALGAAALLRHHARNFRILIIAPKENIQNKWEREIRLFVRNNFIHADGKVRKSDGSPVRSPLVCHGLIAFAAEARQDPDRDFILRMPSFSIGYNDDEDTPDREDWNRRKRELMEIDPAAADFDCRSALEDIWNGFARGVRRLTPQFDLVIVDEGHNLKHGPRPSGAWRNRLMAQIFGAELRQGNPELRAKRVLFLSATPVEHDFEQLYNQLAVFGKQEGFEALKSGKSEDEKKQCARKFLIRRLTSIGVKSGRLTKNQYRRDWRNGGLQVHDEPLPVPGAKQKLIVALIQRRVLDVLGEKFSNSFQIGMLASFESFMETAAHRKDRVFDDPGQTRQEQEKIGADSGTVDALAESYRRWNLGEELPHPKLDAMAEALADCYSSGRKALVFVRRVKSVRDLQRKVVDIVDAQIREDLRSKLSAYPEVERWLGDRWQKYSEEKQRARARTGQESVEALGSEEEERDVGGDSFFAWLLNDRGDGTNLSGAAIREQFTSVGAFLSIFFEENYLALVLGVTPSEVLPRLAQALALSVSTCRKALERNAGRYIKSSKKIRWEEYRAFQRAGLSLLAHKGGKAGRNAQIVLDEIFAGDYETEGGARRVQGGEWLQKPTFMAALRADSEIGPILLPTNSSLNFLEALREGEIRRLLISAQCRLGRSFLDLLVLLLSRRRSLKLRAHQTDDLTTVLIKDFMGELKRQKDTLAGPFGAWQELSLTARNFDLITKVNGIGISGEAFDKVALDIRELLKLQKPAAGMAGYLNNRLVRQFRMPGFPFVLVTTDLLQEGEDLHTFCSSVYHYGISWTPSSMEQRIGRIDRLGSLTERRLSGRGDPAPQDKLQVYFPFLKATIERYQVETVLRRLDRFMILMHKNLGSAPKEANRLNLSLQPIQERTRLVVPVDKPLETDFDIPAEMLPEN